MITPDLILITLFAAAYLIGFLVLLRADSIRAPRSPRTRPRPLTEGYQPTGRATLPGKVPALVSAVVPPNRQRFTPDA